MAEIGMIRDTWELKLQLCWWHMKDAIKKRLAKAKLSTSPYNAERAAWRIFVYQQISSGLQVKQIQAEARKGGEHRDDAETTDRQHRRQAKCNHHSDCITSLDDAKCS